VKGQMQKMDCFGSVTLAITHCMKHTLNCETSKKIFCLDSESFMEVSLCERANLVAK
jgi:hypothetical protein